MSLSVARCSDPALLAQVFRVEQRAFEIVRPAAWLVYDGTGNRLGGFYIMRNATGAEVHTECPGIGRHPEAKQMFRRILDSQPENRVTTYVAADNRPAILQARRLGFLWRGQIGGNVHFEHLRP